MSSSFRATLTTPLPHLLHSDAVRQSAWRYHFEPVRVERDLHVGPFVCVVSMHQSVDHGFAHGVGGEGFLAVAAAAFEPCDASHVPFDKVNRTVDDPSFNDATLFGNNRG